jgi:hypothetical protein
MLVAWAIATFVFHKSGSIHMLLLMAITFYVIQFAQDRRTKEYERSLRK